VVKFTKTDYFFFFSSLILSGGGMSQPINPTFGYILIIIGIVGMVSVLLRSSHRKQNADNLSVKSLKSLLSDTHSLYNNTGLFIQACYNDRVKTSSGKRMDLDKEFKNYLKVFKGRMLELPQELEPKISSFVYILEDYAKRGEIIISLPKTPECYRRQKKLEQEFSNNAPVLYSEIEVELRKLLNKKTNPT